jgi:outer membrane protein assembly factor BamA
MPGRTTMAGLALIGALLTIPSAGTCEAASTSDTTEARTEPITLEGELAKKQGRAFPPRLVIGRIIYLPKAYYSATSGFGIGGQLIAPFRLTESADTTPLSDFRVKGRITLKRQGKVEAMANLFFDRNTYFAKMRFAYTDLAFDYYGIGPNTPRSNEEVIRPRNFLFYTEFFRRLVSSLRIGVRTEVNSVESISFEPDGLIESERLLEQTNATVIGFGGGLDWNTTDRAYSPTDGVHWRAFGLWFDKDTGSEFDFNQYVVDLRHYVGLRENHVFATQLFLFVTDGSAPFFRLAQLGGHEHTRGYKTARYRDDVLFAFQASYRCPIVQRVGIALFAGAGVVDERVQDLRSKYLRPTVGAGLQLRTASMTGIVARADVAVGQEDVRFYLSLDEAF